MVYSGESSREKRRGSTQESDCRLDCRSSATRRKLKKSSHGLDHTIDVHIRQKRVHRQADDTRTDLIRIRATRGTKLRKGFLTMQRNRIMNQRRDIALFEVRTEFVTLRRRDCEQVVIA